MEPQKGAGKKICVKCQRILSLDDFYTNKKWRQQLYHDAWCKECVNEFCKTKEDFKRYMFENNRGWKEAIWESSKKIAEKKMVKDEEYHRLDDNPEEQRKYFETQIIKIGFWQMNVLNYYEFVDNADVTYAPDEEGEEELTYSPVWRGYFTKDQVAALEDLYSQYEEDFVLDNVNIKDYARKVAKASLNADIAEDKMRRGKIPASEYKEAQKIFDDLSKSSNFAACRRKPGDSSGMGNLGEIILRLELGGQLNENGFTFPKDDVDRIIEDFRHTLKAVGAEGRLD